NWIIFNQSFNTTLSTAGGGLAIEGEPQPGNCEGGPFDAGCPNTISDGTGNVTVDGNLIQGNTSEGGSGGGIRLQDVNGSDVIRNPNNLTGINPTTHQPYMPWWQLTITNNMIVNNISAWAGAGISLSDTANSSIINNTIMSNDSTATAGPLLNTTADDTGRPLVTLSQYQPAGIT